MRFPHKLEEVFGSKWVLGKGSHFLQSHNYWYVVHVNKELQESIIKLSPQHTHTYALAPHMCIIGGPRSEEEVVRM